MMVKLRFMVVGADKLGGCSTAADDKRIKDFSAKTTSPMLN